MSPEGCGARAEREAFFRGRKVGRVVVKLGSATVTDPEAGLRERTIRSLAAQVAKAGADSGVSFVVVTSGAIAAGRKRLWPSEHPPKGIAFKQAAAAVGQTTLMRAYERAFEKRGLRVGQVLLTHEDFEDRKRYVNARTTLETLLSLGVVPVINENDAVATEEIRLGDNDTLAALVCQMVGADLLVLLTDTDGLYTKDPHAHSDARRIPLLAGVSDEDLASAGGRRAGSVGTGGMASKLRAARTVSAWGTPAAIASAFSRSPLLDVLAGKDAGTLVLPPGKVRARSRKMWIAHASHVSGSVTVDDGAKKVLLEGGKSLLPAGITAVEGTFAAGDTVSIRDRKGRPFARGLSSWSSGQVALGMGRKTADLGALPGATVPPEVIHRDNMTILPPPRGTEGPKESVKR